MGNRVTKPQYRNNRPQMIKTIKTDNWSWAVFSPENYPPAVYFRKLASKFSDSDFDSMPLNEINQACAKLSDNITLIVDNDKDDVTLDYLFDRIKVSVFRHGIKGVVLDPWNELIHDIGAREDIYLNKVLRKIKRFIRKYDLSFWLVAHPRNPKRNNDGTYPRITAYDIAGGYAWFAKADNVFSVWRDKTNSQLPIEVEIQKIKYKTDGTLGTCFFHWDYDSGNYKSVSSSLDEGVQDCQGRTVNGQPGETW